MRQVECGLNLTVALTTDGRIWQMGETGAPGHKLAPWEGAREPQQVTSTLTLDLSCKFSLFRPIPLLVCYLEFSSSDPLLVC